MESLVREKEKMKELDTLRVGNVVDETKKTKVALEHLCALLDDKEKALEEQEAV